ncbi:hypothetical protein GCM10027214_06190 [Stenotrophomonas tumulicola]
MTVTTTSDSMFDSQASREVWVTPLPMFNCHGLGSADCAHPNAGNPIPATMAAAPDTHLLPHPLRCFIA